MQNLSPTTRTNRTSSKSCTQLQLPLLALIATILAMVLLPTTTTRQRMNQTSSKTRTCSAHLQLPHLALIATILAMVHAFLLSTTTMSQRTSMTTCRELVLPSPPGRPSNRADRQALPQLAYFRSHRKAALAKSSFEAWSHEICST